MKISFWALPRYVSAAGMYIIARFGGFWVWIVVIFCSHYLGALSYLSTHIYAYIYIHITCHSRFSEFCSRNDDACEEKLRATERVREVNNKSLFRISTFARIISSKSPPFFSFSMRRRRRLRPIPSESRADHHPIRPERSSARPAVERKRRFVHLFRLDDGKWGRRLVLLLLLRIASRFIISPRG